MAAADDSLVGAPTTLYLDRQDVIKLRDVLNKIAHPANVGNTLQATALLKVLRRLSTMPLTVALCHDTGIDQTVVALHAYREPAIAELAKRISALWAKQLAEEAKQKERAEARAAPPAPPPPREPLGCPACRSQKCAHMCGTKGKHAQKQRTQD